MGERSEKDIDQEYLRSLEERLNLLKKPKEAGSSKELLRDIGKAREQQLIELISGRDSKFEDDFIDVPIQANWIQKKVAPESVAVNKQELLRLVRNDLFEITVSKIDKELEAEGSSAAKKEVKAETSKKDEE